MVLKRPRYIYPPGNGHLSSGIYNPLLSTGPQCTVMEHFLLIRVLGQIVGIEDVNQQENGNWGEITFPWFGWAA